MRIRIRAKNPRGTHAYHVEPYTVQHFVDWLIDVPKTYSEILWYLFRHFTSKTFRMEQARAYNQLMFAHIPTSQIYVTDGNQVRPLREDERTWPE